MLLLVLLLVRVLVRVLLRVLLSLLVLSRVILLSLFPALERFALPPRSLI